MLEPALSYERVLAEVRSATPVRENQTIDQWLRHTARIVHKLLEDDKPPLPSKQRQLARSQRLLAAQPDHSDPGCGEI
jgi:hypothetical protein